jgi:tryptophan-rich sensory protein
MTGIASKSQLRMSFLRHALVTVPSVLLLGMLSRALSGAGAGNGWYAGLRKPPVMPPDWLLGTGWMILYILLGLSLAMLLHARGARRRGRLIAVFALLLVLVLAWPPLFFGFHQLPASLSLVAATLVVTIGLILGLWRIRIVAALLLYPLLAWLMFLGLIGYRLLALNPAG